MMGFLAPAPAAEPPAADAPPADDAEFIASETFAGVKAGYKFTMGPSGMGYYKDDGVATD
jgi:hypothetical protein